MEFAGELLRQAIDCKFVIYLQFIRSGLFVCSF